MGELERWLTGNPVPFVWSPLWHASLAYSESLSARGLPPLESDLRLLKGKAGKGIL